MSLDLCLKQLHVVHIKVCHCMQYTFALVLLRHFPVCHFPVLQIPVTLPVWMPRVVTLQWQQQ